MSDKAVYRMFLGIFVLLTPACLVAAGLDIYWAAVGALNPWVAAAFVVLLSAQAVWCAVNARDAYREAQRC